MSDNKVKSPSGGVAGLFRRFFHSLVYYFHGFRLFFIEVFTFHNKFDVKKVPRRPGEVAVITGGARGIGIEVVRKLLILDMHVVIGCRNKETGEQAVEELLRKKGGIVTGSVNVLTLDLMSFESVKDFGNKVYLKYPKIHLLINNSGIMTVDYALTKDGNESQLQVNYLSHFLLTNLLLPKLIRGGRAGKTSRVVNVSSGAHYGGKIDFEDINMQKMYSKKMAYMASKFMQVVSTLDLNSRLEKEGVNVRVYAVHPGVVKTDLHKVSLSVMCFMYTLGWLYKSPEEGADGVVYAAISSKFEGEGGYYFQNSGKTSVNSLAKKEQVQKRLWEESCKLTGWEEKPISEMVKEAMTFGRKVQQGANGNKASASAPVVVKKELKRQESLEIAPLEEDASKSAEQEPRISIISASSSSSSKSTHTLVGNEQCRVVIHPATATECSSSSSSSSDDSVGEDNKSGGGFQAEEEESISIPVEITS